MTRATSQCCTGVDENVGDRIFCREIRRRDFQHHPFSQKENSLREEGVCALPLPWFSPPTFQSIETARSFSTRWTKRTPFPSVDLPPERSVRLLCADHVGTCTVDVSVDQIRPLDHVRWQGCSGGDQHATYDDLRNHIRRLQNHIM